MTTKDKPSAQIVEPQASQKITDKSGRVLRYKPLTLLEQTRLMRAVGAHSTNQGFYSIAAAAVGVREIDDLPYPFPTTEAHVDKAIERLGDDGLEALMEHINREQEAVEQKDVWAEAKN